MRFILKIVFIFEIIQTLVFASISMGSYTHQFSAGDEVEVNAVKLTSLITHIPYPYYSLKFCKPESPIVYLSQNLGEILRGDQLVNTPFNIKMAEDRDCTLLCPSKILSADESNLFIKMIQGNYFVHLMIDGLPVLSKYVNGNDKKLVHGYALGYVKNGKVYLNNQLKFIIKYNTEMRYLFNVVGFQIETSSFAYTKTFQCKNATKAVSDLEILPDRLNEIFFFYEVQWQKSNVKWSSRWDAYMVLNDDQVHWFSILNSVIIIILLSGILTMIMLRTLRKDIAIYNKDITVEDALEESGWKLVHGDIFRPPKYPYIFVAIIGSGVQLLCTCMIIIVCSVLGFLSPLYRGDLLNSTIFTYTFTGIFSGFFAGRIYKTIGGEKWIVPAIWTGTLVPVAILIVGTILNLITEANNSPAAVPLIVIMELIALLFGITLPLALLGFFFGFRQTAYFYPVRINSNQRQIPQQKCHQNSLITIMLAGVLPFGAVLIELFYLLTAIWESQFYNLFGYLLIVFIILIIAVSQVSIVMVYLQICYENYHWWWRTFFVSGGSAIYVFGFMIFYYFTKLHISQFVPTVMYFCYSLMIAFFFLLTTGTVGFYSSFWFLRRIYSAIKID